MTSIPTLQASQAPKVSRTKHQQSSTPSDDEEEYQSFSWDLAMIKEYAIHREVSRTVTTALRSYFLQPEEARTGQLTLTIGGVSDLQVEQPPTSATMLDILSSFEGDSIGVFPTTTSSPDSLTNLIQQSVITVDSSLRFSCLVCCLYFEPSVSGASLEALPHEAGDDLLFLMRQLSVHCNSARHLQRLRKVFTYCDRILHQDALVSSAAFDLGKKFSFVYINGIRTLVSNAVGGHPRLHPNTNRTPDVQQDPAQFLASVNRLPRSFDDGGGTVREVHHHPALQFPARQWSTGTFPHRANVAVSASGKHHRYQQGPGKLATNSVVRLPLNICSRPPAIPEDLSSEKKGKGHNPITKTHKRSLLLCFTHAALTQEKRLAAKEMRKLEKMVAKAKEEKDSHSAESASTLHDQNEPNVKKRSRQQTSDKPIVLPPTADHWNPTNACFPWEIPLARGEWRTVLVDHSAVVHAQKVAKTNKNATCYAVPVVAVECDDVGEDGMKPEPPTELEGGKSYTVLRIHLSRIRNVGPEKEVLIDVPWGGRNIASRKRLEERVDEPRNDEVES